MGDVLLYLLHNEVVLTRKRFMLKTDIKMFTRGEECFVFSIIFMAHILSIMEQLTIHWHKYQVTKCNQQNKMTKSLHILTTKINKNKYLKLENNELVLF